MRKPRAIKSEAVDKTKPAYIVVDKWGGLAAFCSDCQIPTSTAWRWLLNGLIPARRQAHILACATRFRKPIRPADFVPLAVAA